MTITLKADSGIHPAHQPYPTADFVVVASSSCPHCSAEGIRGNGKHRVETQRDEEEDAVCAECGKPRGRIHVELDTLFGRDEDARVLFGRCRVY